MTNEMVIPYLDQVLKVNDALLGIPALPLVFLGCIVLGYMLKAVPFVRNRWIPACSFVFGILCNLGITPLQNLADGIRAVILGMVSAGAAWFAHQKWLKTLIDEKLFQANDTNPVAFIKPKE